MENISKILMHRVLLPDISNYLRRDQHREETPEDVGSEIPGSCSSKLPTDTEHQSIVTSDVHETEAVSMQLEETSHSGKQIMLSPKKNRDKQTPLTESDNWLSFDEPDTLGLDMDADLWSKDTSHQWRSTPRPSGSSMLFESDIFHIEDQEMIAFPETPLGSVHDDDNESATVSSDDDSRIPKSVRERLNTFTPFKFLSSRSGKAPIDHELPLSRKTSFFTKSTSEDGLELLGDWKQSTASHLAFDIDSFKADDFILEETEAPSLWNIPGDETSPIFGSRLSLPLVNHRFFEREQRDDSDVQGSFLYDDCNQRIPRPPLSSEDTSYGARLCFSFLDSFTCQSELMHPYREFDKIENRQRRRQSYSRRTRKKISKKKRKKRLREQREGSHRASNFQCNLSTIVEHSDEDNDSDHTSLQVMSAVDSDDTQSFSLQSSSTGDGSVNSYEDTPYSDGLYNPRDLFLVASKIGDWELQEMQEI
jgi:hypothetical protein